MSNFTKPYLPVADQLALLLKRGMIISDQPKALSYLSRIGYYRLSAYWHPFRQTTVIEGAGSDVRVEDHFKPNTEFQTIVDLYVFDKKLRLLFMDLLERIEVSLRTEIALQMGQYGVWAHRDPALLNRKFAAIPDLSGRTTHHEWLRKLDEKAATSKEQYAIHFRTKYPDSPLPIWVAVELHDFGALSHFLSGMRTADAWAVARKYAIPRPELLIRWVRTFCDVRNVCAHHSRLWNKAVANEPPPPKAGEIPLLQHLIHSHPARSRIYGAAAVGQYMLRTINPTSQWDSRLKELVASFPTNPHVSVGSMGAPAGWQALPLWE